MSYRRGVRTAHIGISLPACVPLPSAPYYRCVALYVTRITRAAARKYHQQRQRRHQQRRAGGTSRRCDNMAQRLIARIYRALV